MSLAQNNVMSLKRFYRNKISNLQKAFKRRKWNQNEWLAACQFSHHSQIFAQWSDSQVLVHPTCPNSCYSIVAVCDILNVLQKTSRHVIDVGIISFRIENVFCNPWRMLPLICTSLILHTNGFLEHYLY